MKKKSCSTSFYMQKHQVIFNLECGLRAFVYMQINCLLKCANCYSIFVACKIFPNDLTDEYVCAHLKKRLPFPLALATVCLNIKAYRVLKHSILDNAFFYCAFSMSGSKYHAWIQCPIICIWLLVREYNAFLLFKFHRFPTEYQPIMKLFRRHSLTLRIL